MSASSDAPAAPPSADPVGESLRVRGLVLVILLLIEFALGNQLAGAGSPYPVVYLAGHIALALLVSGFAGHLFVRARRRPGGALRVGAGLAFLAAVGATLGGTWFLLGGMTNPALYTMEGFGGLALLGAIVVIVFGGPVRSPPPTHA